MSKNMPNAAWVWVPIILFVGAWYFFATWVEAHYLPIILVSQFVLFMLLLLSVLFRDRDTGVDNERVRIVDEKLQQILDKL
jgi:hypothetical protein